MVGFVCNVLCLAHVCCMLLTAYHMLLVFAMVQTTQTWLSHAHLLLVLDLFLSELVSRWPVHEYVPGNV